MITRRDVLSRAADDCLKKLYTLVQPAVEWEDFIKQCEEYTSKYNEWEKNRDNHPEWKDKRINDCIGPRPYEFYYLPKEVLKEVTDSYIYAYRIDIQQELLDTIDTLKEYCDSPIVDKYIEGHTDADGVHHPGHRGYEHPDNIIIKLTSTFEEMLPLHFDNNLSNKLACEARSIMHSFLDMAGKFYNWNGELNSFNMTVYLGPSPNSNKKAVIENWKKYRNTDIVIDESKWENEE